MTEMKIDTEIRAFDPRELKLLDLNARFMPHSMYQRLVENIRRDQALTSAPLVAQVYDDVDTPTGVWEVLSGNHRVQAAIDAGLATIFAIAVDQYLTPDQRTAMQLSHNAIDGQDDPGVLKQLYESISELDMREYAGLDDKALELLKQIQPGNLKEANLDYQSLTVVFFQDEMEAVSDTVDLAMNLASTADRTYTARLEEHMRLLNALDDVASAYNATNVAAGLKIILDIFDAHQEDIEDGWWDNLEQTIRQERKWVPLHTLTGRKAPTKAAATLRRAITKGQHGDTSIPGWQILSNLAEQYLAED